MRERDEDILKRAVKYLPDNDIFIYSDVDDGYMLKINHNQDYLTYIPKSFFDFNLLDVNYHFRLKLLSHTIFEETGRKQLFNLSPKMCTLVASGKVNPNTKTVLGNDINPNIPAYLTTITSRTKSDLFYTELMVSIIQEYEMEYFYPVVWIPYGKQLITISKR